MEWSGVAEVTPAEVEVEWLALSGEEWSGLVWERCVRGACVREMKVEGREWVNGWVGHRG